MKTPRLHIALFLAWCMFAIAGCSSTPETAQTIPADTTVVEPPSMVFETRTDTVNSEHPPENGPSGQSENEPFLRFGVQIGAFKDPFNATRIQQLAKERFQMPVMNDFHADSAMYHVRIGAFTTRDSAYVFRDRIQKEYPQDYKDSWIVQFMKQP